MEIYIEKRLTENKSYCFQVIRYKPYIEQLIDTNIEIMSNTYYFIFICSFLGSIFHFQFSWSKKTDHAGFIFDLTIFGFSIMFIIYDNRHWDYDNNTWVK